MRRTVFNSGLADPKYTLLLALILTMACRPVFAEEDSAKDDPPPADPLLSIERIYKSGEFGGKGFGGQWLEAGSYSGSQYTTFEPAKHGPGRDLVRHDPKTGESEVLVSAALLTPPGKRSPLGVHGHQWSQDMAKLLIYTNSQRVWRSNTRGDYWVLDRSARQLKQLGGDASAASLMFAKFSPTGRRVGYVCERDIYIEDLLSGKIQRMTHSNTDDVINGTTDWVYEEEFMLRDGFAWSPDGRYIAYWQINTKGVERMPLINHTDAMYPKVQWFAYPKTGQINPAARIGVLDCSSGETTWIDLPGDPRDHYIPRMQWANDSDQLVVQQFNRLQNENRVYLANRADGLAKLLFSERDEAWVDVHDELFWLEDGRHFTWISERDGWRHAYLVSREDGEIRLLTPGNFDVIRLLHVDEALGVAYFIASPKNATQRYLYSAKLDGSGVQRVTPGDLTGTHDYRISPDGLWALHTYSSASRPPIWDLVFLPIHVTMKTFEDNQQLVSKLKTLQPTAQEFFRVDIGEGVELDGWCVKPPEFDPKKKYPLLIYVYGEPAGQTVVDRWGGGGFLWHAMLAQRGYVVMSFDNRGTKSPRGREFRKCVYRQIGTLGPDDQAAALQKVLSDRPYLDPRRVGIWGWSGGGSSTLHALFKYPKLYAMGISIAPVPNQRYYDTIYQERYMGLPDDNVDGYRNGSPISFAHQLEGDLLIVHGTGDDNCHYQTVEMLVDELVAHDKQFTMMAYPNRTHSISERKNTTLHLRRLMLEFIDRNLPIKMATTPTATKANAAGSGTGE